MKLVRYGHHGKEKLALVDADGKLHDLSAIVPDMVGIDLLGGTAAGTLIACIALTLACASHAQERKALGGSASLTGPIASCHSAWDAPVFGRLQLYRLVDTLSQREVRVRENIVAACSGEMGGDSFRPSGIQGRFRPEAAASSE